MYDVHKIALAAVSRVGVGRWSTNVGVGVAIFGSGTNQARIIWHERLRIGIHFSNVSIGGKNIAHFTAGVRRTNTVYRAACFAAGYRVVDQNSPVLKVRLPTNRATSFGAAAIIVLRCNREEKFGLTASTNSITLPGIWAR